MLNILLLSNISAAAAELISRLADSQQADSRKFAIITKHLRNFISCHPCATFYTSSHKE
jgi:hypothetical protein